MADIVKMAEKFIKDQDKLKERLAELKAEKKVKQKEYKTILAEAKKLCGATDLKSLKAELEKLVGEIEDIMTGAEDDDLDQ